jgi:ABC-type sulfate/molybdate transport systems ATPase subunit
MALELRGVTYEALEDVSAAAPDGAIIGLVGEDGHGVEPLLRVAAGVAPPESGEVSGAGPRRFVGPADPLNLAPVQVLCLADALDLHDALVRRRAYVGLERLRRAGATIIVSSHDMGLLRDLCDEVWWVNEGRIEARGDTREVIARFESHLMQRFAQWGASMPVQLTPVLRRGDGRARVLSIELLNAEDHATTVFRAGELSSMEIVVRFDEAVENPVIGIMIRTRIGFDVFGTNTELEGVRLGPCTDGETLRVRFTFPCQLCPQDYTLTAASHDPDGVWHDWLEDAVSFSVTASRYTAGVADLKAHVTFRRQAGA